MEEFGLVRGHFGPINTVAFHPDGSGFVTGSHAALFKMLYAEFLEVMAQMYMKANSQMLVAIK